MEGKVKNGQFGIAEMGEGGFASIKGVNGNEPTISSKYLAHPNEIENSLEEKEE